MFLVATGLLVEVTGTWDRWESDSGSPLCLAGTAVGQTATSLKKFFLRGFPKLAVAFQVQTGFFLLSFRWWQSPVQGLS